MLDSHRTIHHRRRDCAEKREEDAFKSQQGVRSQIEANGLIGFCRRVFIIYSSGSSEVLTSSILLLRPQGENGRWLVAPLNSEVRSGIICAGSGKR